MNNNWVLVKNDTPSCNIYYRTIVVIVLVVSRLYTFSCLIVFQKVGVSFSLLPLKFNCNNSNWYQMKVYLCQEIHEAFWCVYHQYQQKMQDGHDYPVGKFDHCHNSQYDYGVTCNLAMTLITLLIALYHILVERKCEDFSREIFFSVHI